MTNQIIIERSNKPKFKYMAISPLTGKYIYFGKANEKHYIDRTGLGLYSYLDTYDNDLRAKRLKKFTSARDENGLLLCFNSSHRFFYEVNYIW